MVKARTITFPCALLLLLNSWSCAEKPKTWTDLPAALKNPERVKILKLRLRGDEKLADIGRFSNLEILVLEADFPLELDRSGFRAPPELARLENLRALTLRGVHPAPPSIPESVRELSISYCNTTHCNPGAHEKSSVFGLSIGHLRKLRDLRINFHDHPVRLQGLEKISALLTLKISGGKNFKSWPRGLRLHKNLRDLEISRTGLTEIPDELKDLGDLKTLNLSANRLTALPVSIGQLKDLEQLWVARNRLPVLPDEMTALNGLRVLDVSDNLLTELPAEFALLKNLDVFKLSGNRLGKFPSVLFEFVRMRALDIGRNQIAVLPPDIAKMRNLSSLSLHGNQLTELPKLIADLSKLRALRVSCNQINLLPADFDKLRGLRDLRLNLNRLRDFPYILTRMPWLEKLYLSGNTIITVPAAIGEITALRELGLSHNNIHELPSRMGDLQSLKKLKLGGNPIKFLPRSIGGLGKLQSLDLHRTRMRRHPPWLLQWPASPPRVHVDSRTRARMVRRAKRKHRRSVKERLGIGTESPEGKRAFCKTDLQRLPRLAAEKL